MTSGKLDNLTFELAPSTLNIGGSTAATLTTTSFYPEVSSGSLTVEFGLGSSASDLWDITQPITGPETSFIFDIQNLGGLATGTKYTLINTTSLGIETPSDFSLSSADTSAGMAGTFTVSPNQVSVSFSSLPEPTAASLVLSALAGGCGLLRFRSRGIRRAGGLNERQNGAARS
jgi:hypothetical protein